MPREADNTRDIEQVDRGWIGWLDEAGGWPPAAAPTMPALRLHRFGDAPAVDAVAIPEPGDHEVLVRVAAAALNPLDVKIQAGWMCELFPVDLPYVIGTDLSGTIGRVGAKVSGWVAGDSVIARTDPLVGGAAARYAVVPADQLVAAPTSIDLVDAASLATAAATAWQALSEVADVGAGQRVLVHGGAGSVGGFAVRFAKQLGAHVVSTACGPGLDIARRLGADRVIDYANEDFTALTGDLEVVIDTVGGDVEARSLTVLRPGGLLVSLPMPPDEARAADHGVRARFAFHQSDAGRLADAVRRLDGTVPDGIGAAGSVAERTPLFDAVAAWNRLARGDNRGKVILLPAV